MNSFRQVCDKPCANSIIQAEWSPLWDLVAVVTSNGDVRLHRMYWQKVWVIAAKDALATCLAWKCNGKLLAVGYNNGDVAIVEIEKAVVVHTLNHKEKITSLNWTEKPLKVSSAANKQFPESFLPDIKKEELKASLAQGDLLIADSNRYCFLTIGTAAGNVYLYLEGVFLVLEILQDKYLLSFQQHCIVSTHLCLDNGTITVVSKSLAEKADEGTNSSYYLHQFISTALCDSNHELSLLSSKFSKILFLVQRCKKVLKQISDASEDISLKINSKLEKLEKLLDLTESNIAAEFTVAYATGETSAELQTFLTQNLTTKGLKQIEQNVQSAYTSMHSDINDELELIVQHIMFHLLELKGMAKWTEKYEAIGLSEVAIQNCFKRLAKFTMKLLKLLEVISSDMENFTVFFTWLTSLCFQFSGEAQSSFPQLSFKDYDIMIDFLDNRLHKVCSDGSSNSYNLERISQFFKEGVSETKETQNLWYEFVEKNEFLKSSPLIITPDNSCTLQELFKSFDEGYKDIFKSTYSSITNSISLCQSINLFEAASGHEENCAPLFSFLQKGQYLYLCVLACSCDSDRLFFIEVNSTHRTLNLAGVSIEPVTENNESINESIDESINESINKQIQYTMKSAKFYNQEFVTFLFEESNTEENHMSTILAQLSIHEIIDVATFVSCNTSFNTGIMDSGLDLTWLNINDRFSEQRKMDNFRGKFVSVNGYTREVCCLVSVSGRRVRVFDMTVEDDDPEESKIDDTSRLNLSKESANEIMDNNI